MFQCTLFFLILTFQGHFANGNNSNLLLSLERNSSVTSYLPESNFTNSPDNISRYNRQLDSEVEKRFHINTNTIIRTGESRLLGAKYLNESLVSSNRDCLTWCLETPNCNAAVYEGKNVHSCYMFDCGPPSSFQCKFTQHESFTSSVLKITQHSYDLRQWGNQVKKEKESQVPLTTEAQSTTPPSPPQEQEHIQVTAVVTTHPVISEKTGIKCQHYQFKCLNSSECIAIYNVCDGIPQCPDGSDESTELKCHLKADVLPDVNTIGRPSESLQRSENKAPDSNQPASLTSPPPSLHPPPMGHVPPPPSKQGVPPNKALGSRPGRPKTIWPDPVQGGQTSRGDYYHPNEVSETDGLGNPFVHKHSQFVAANDPHVQNLNRWSSDYDQYSSRIPADPQYSPYDDTFQRGDEQYLSNPVPPEYDGVKSYQNYRQEDVPYWPNQEAALDNNYPLEEFPQSAVNKQASYPDKESLYAQQLSRTAAAQYPDSSKHHVAHKPVDGGPPAQQNRASEADEYKRYPPQRQAPYLSYEDAVEKQLANYRDLKSKHYAPPRTAAEPAYSNDDLLRASLVKQLPMELDRPHHVYQSDKLTENPIPPPPLQDKGDTPQISRKEQPKVLSTARPTLPPRPVHRAVYDFKMSVTELYQASRTHTQETNSAVLALVVGLTVTVLLAVFLGCRIKTIRKRMSRKGRALAHDADYLVNGMYL